MKDKDLKENTWFQSAKNCCSPLSSLIPVQEEIPEEFENVLLDGVDGTCASLANPRLVVSAQKFCISGSSKNLKDFHRLSYTLQLHEHKPDF